MADGSRIVAYISCSLDGFIADPNGGVEWLHRYSDVDTGVAEFMKRVGVMAMGRKTYDDSRRLGPAPKMDAVWFVLTHRALPADAPPTINTLSGPVNEVAAALRDEAVRRGRDVWLMGGGGVIADFLDAGEVDALDLFVMPTLLRDGVPLFPLRDDAQPIALCLKESQSFLNGVVRLTYTFERGFRNPSSKNGGTL